MMQYFSGRMNFKKTETKTKYYSVISEEKKDEKRNHSHFTMKCLNELATPSRTASNDLTETKIGNYLRSIKFTIPE